jgi:hypothetical protein
MAAQTPQDVSSAAVALRAAQKAVRAGYDDDRAEAYIARQVLSDLAEAEAFWTAWRLTTLEQTIEDLQVRLDLVADELRRALQEPA